jgi:hypothetical protein
MNTQETIEEANWKVLGTKNDTFYNGAKWQAQRMYTEADIQKAFFAGIAVTGEGWNGEYANGNGPEIEKEFFNQFKEWFKTHNTTQP